LGSTGDVALQYAQVTHDAGLPAERVVTYDATDSNLRLARDYARIVDGEGLGVLSAWQISQILNGVRGGYCRLGDEVMDSGLHGIVAGKKHSRP
jgi:hypothetical protein